VWKSGQKSTKCPFFATKTFKVQKHTFQTFYRESFMQKEAISIDQQEQSLMKILKK
jgi:hypothetical protein